MCIPRGSMGTKDSGYIEIKEKKHIQRVSQDEFEHGDPNFIDERTHKDAKEEKQSFCNRIFGK